MQVIVPLAGPDFIQADGSLKAMKILDGQPLLRRVLDTRPWARNITRYNFVLLDRVETRTFGSDTLTQWYPGASVTYLSDYTRGAALSALAALSCGVDFSEPLIIDLADIFYDSSLDPMKVLDADPDCGGIALTFQSNNPAYSYLRTDQNGNFLEAAEKQVVSQNASAGTYVFRDTGTYLRALAHALENESTQTFRSLFYICPLFNGVREQGKDVKLVPVNDILDIKMKV